METRLGLTGLALYTPQGRRLAKDLNVSLKPGELLLIEGSNGSGKTTLLKAILGLHKEHSGAMVCNYLPEDVSYLPQLGNVQFLIPLTLGEVIKLRSQGRPAVQDVSLLLSAEYEVAWNTASGGERQKALLSGIFTVASKLLVLDEPFNHLDAATVGVVVNLIVKSLKSGSSVVIVSHDLKPIQDLQSKRLQLRGVQ